MIILSKIEKKYTFNPLVKPIKIGEKYVYFNMGNWNWVAVPASIHEIIISEINNEDSVISLLPVKQRELVDHFLMKLISLRYLVADLKSLELGKGIVYTVPLYAQMKFKEGNARIQEIVIDMSQPYSKHVLSQCKDLNVQISGVLSKHGIENTLEICSTYYVAASDIECIINNRDKLFGKRIIVELDMNLSKTDLLALRDIKSTLVFHIPLLIEPMDYPLLKHIIEWYDYYFTYCFYTAKNFYNEIGNDEIGAIFRNPNANSYLLKLKVNCKAGKDSIFVNTQGTVYGCIHDEQNGKKALMNIGDSDLDLRAIEMMNRINIDTIPKCQKCCVRYFCADTCGNKNITGFSISCENLNKLVIQNI